MPAGTTADSQIHQGPPIGRIKTVAFHGIEIPVAQIEGDGNPSGCRTGPSGRLGPGGHPARRRQHLLSRCRPRAVLLREGGPLVEPDALLVDKLAGGKTFASKAIQEGLNLIAIQGPGPADQDGVGIVEIPAHPDRFGVAHPDRAPEDEGFGELRPGKNLLQGLLAGFRRVKFLPEISHKGAGNGILEDPDHDKKNQDGDNSHQKNGPPSLLAASLGPASGQGEHLAHELQGYPWTPVKTPAHRTRVQADRSSLLRKLKRLITGGIPVAGVPAADRILDRLERDLLPRTAGGDRYLVAGIVGPNNAGKSSLFNSLAGAPLSPADPAGGTTRRLLGTAHPALLEQLAADPSLSRFPLRSLSPLPSGRVPAVPDGSALAEELLVVEQARFPENLLLIDTPDFDSILVENRAASEALLAVADLVITVVTRHSYQNREVVTFLRNWLSHGRPWMLVYNEGIDADSVRAHAEKLGSDLGCRPAAVFWAPHDLEIQRGTAALDPQALDAERKSLRETLLDLERVADFKAEALRASLERLREDLRELAEELQARGSLAEGFLAQVESRAHSLALEIARAAMPVGPFVEAFQAVLNRRAPSWSRGWRSALRKLRLKAAGLASTLPWRKKTAPPPDPAGEVLALETERLAAAWPSFWEELARDFGPEARRELRGRADAELADRLDADLSEKRRQAARLQLAECLNRQAPGLEEFRQTCENLVEEALRKRGRDWDIQLAADLVTLGPMVLATAVIVHTGGLGADLAVAGGGTLGTLFTGKISHLVGSAIIREAEELWQRLRADQLRGMVVGTALETAAPLLQKRKREHPRSAAGLLALAEELQ